MTYPGWANIVSIKCSRVYTILRLLPRSLSLSVQSWYDQSAQAVQPNGRAAGEEDAEEAENLRPASSIVCQGGAEVGEARTAGEVWVSLLSVVVVDHHPEHGEEHGQLEEDGVDQ